MAVYNDLAVVDGILGRHALAPASFSVNLYGEHWTLGLSQSKFLYNNPVASLLDDIRAQRIPTDFIEIFESAGLKFYEGCLIVELLDYRPVKGREAPLETPEISRVLLQPTGESFAADLARLAWNAEMRSDVEVLELEAKMLLHTSPPLCLDPDPYLGRLAATAQQLGSKPVPGALKRKAAAIEEAEAEREANRKHKVVQFMNPRQHRSVVPSNRITLLLEEKQKQPTKATAHAMVGLALPGSVVDPQQHHALPTHYPNVAPVNGVSNPSVPTMANSSFALRPPPRAAQPSPAPRVLPSPAPPIPRASSTQSTGRASPAHPPNGNVAGPPSRPPSTQVLTPVLTAAPAPTTDVAGAGVSFAAALPNPGFLKSLPPSRNPSTAPPAPVKTPIPEAGRPQPAPYTNGAALPVAHVSIQSLAQINDPNQMLRVMQRRQIPPAAMTAELQRQIADIYNGWLRALAAARQAAGQPQGQPVAQSPAQTNLTAMPTPAPSQPPPPPPQYPLSAQGLAPAQVSSSSTLTHAMNTAATPGSGHPALIAAASPSFNSPIKAVSPMPPHTQPMPPHPTPPAIDALSSPMPRAMPMPRTANSPMMNPNTAANPAQLPVAPGADPTAAKNTVELQLAAARQNFQKIVAGNPKYMQQARLMAAQYAAKDGSGVPNQQHLHAAMSFMFNRWYQTQQENKRNAAASSSQPQPSQPAPQLVSQVSSQLHPQAHPQPAQQVQPVQVAQPQPQSQVQSQPQPQPPQGQPLYRQPVQHPSVAHQFQQQQQQQQQGFPPQQLQPAQLGMQQGFNAQAVANLPPQVQAQLRNLGIANQNGAQMQQSYLWLVQQQQFQQRMAQAQAQQQAGVGRGAPPQAAAQPYATPQYMAALAAGRGQMPQQPPAGR